MYLAILNQKVYPGAGDVDDCWAVATIWAYRASTGATSLPTMTAFRAAAGNPDRPGPTGGNITDIMRAVGRLWPSLPVEEYEHPSWDAFATKVKAGGIASLAVLSSLLPKTMRYGFMGAHQIGVFYENGFLIANPLAPQGSDPQPIKETILRDAALAVANGWVLAAIFPRGDDVFPDRIKYQWWTASPSDAALRVEPLRSSTVTMKLPGGTQIMSAGEYRDADGNSWRVAEWPVGSGTPVYFLRYGPGVAADHDFIAGPVATLGASAAELKAATQAGYGDAKAKAVAITKKAAAEAAAL